MKLNRTSLEAAQYTLDLCARIATHTDIPGTITRTFLSPATRAVHTLLRDEMQSLDMSVRTDAVGNLRGIYPAHLPFQGPHLSFRGAAEESASSAAAPTPTLLIGSHIDTVPHAGPYDGILGVALPLALLRVLHQHQTKLPYAIELIAFSEEEGIRFALPFIGSRALAGTLSPEDLLRTDIDGITLRQAIRDFGLNPDTLSNAALTPHTFAFLEPHIEQGPVLDSLSLPLAIVSTIAGQSRFQLTFTGQANHAGTTPMHLRRDALAAAAEFILAVEHYARATPGLVATVGAISAAPGAPNVIPGAVTHSLDIRHPDDSIRLSSARALLERAAQIAAARNIALTSIETSQQPSVPMEPALRAELAAALTACGYPPHTMPSGAGHDAMILAFRVPSAMLFLRSPDGISHHPSESVLLEDVQAAIETLLHFLTRLSPVSSPVTHGHTLPGGTPRL